MKLLAFACILFLLLIAVTEAAMPPPPPPITLTPTKTVKPTETIVKELPVNIFYLPLICK